MPVVLHQEGFRFMIYYNDYSPPHTHVYKAGTEVVINLGDGNNSPSVRDIKGMSSSSIKKGFTNC